MKKITREWIKKAENDYETALQSSEGQKPLHEIVCFHCQQCAEKYLKGLLEEHGHTAPRTHNLDDVLQLLIPQFLDLRPLRRGLIFLTNFAVATRYPGKNASKRQATAALRWADKVRTRARALLGLRAKR